MIQPIEHWWRLIQEPLDREKVKQELMLLYTAQRPHIAEIALQGRCPNTCLHCIYPPEYQKFNRTASVDEWLRMLDTILQRLDIRRYIFSGRYISSKEIEVIHRFTTANEDINCGLILDGDNLREQLQPIISLEPEWVDISVDGVSRDHDQQRNRPGGYRNTLELIRKVIDMGRIRRLNILTCLTTINAGGIVEMITELNRYGLRTFILSPVVVVNGARPSPSLKLTPKNLDCFLQELLLATPRLNDAWIEMALYDPRDLVALRATLNKDFSGPFCNGVHLEWILAGPTEVHVVYYPTSLSGITEVIVNSDGSIILPKAVAHGRIPSSLNLGYIDDLLGTDEPLAFMTCDKSIAFNTEELLHEHSRLHTWITASFHEKAILNNQSGGLYDDSFID